MSVLQGRAVLNSKAWAAADALKRVQLMDTAAVVTAPAWVLTSVLVQILSQAVANELSVLSVVNFALGLYPWHRLHVNLFLRDRRNLCSPYRDVQGS